MREPDVIPVSTPSRSYRGLRVAGVVTTGVLVLGMAGNTLPMMIRQEADRTLSAPTEEARRLVVDSSIGEIHITGDPEVTELQISTASSWSFARPAVDLAHNGDTVVLTSSCALGGLGGGCSVDLDITVPEGLDVDVSTTVGDVTVNLPWAPDSVEARSTVGDVSLSLPGDVTYRVVEVDGVIGDESVSVPESPDATHQLTARTTVGDVSLDTEGSVNF